MDQHRNFAPIARFTEWMQSGFKGDAEFVERDVVWHYFNPRLPQLSGDYRGREGLRDLFAQLTTETQGTFRTRPLRLEAFGDEIVVGHAIHQLRMEGRPIEVDAVVVWRIVGEQIVEAWDIPAVNTVRELAPGR